MPVARLVSAVEEIDPELVASRQLNLISLEAIREALGDRWPRRRDQVWAHVDRVVGRGLEPGDLFRRVSEVDYLLAFTTVPARIARARCLQLLNDLQTHFLGESEPGRLRLDIVRSVGGGVIRTEPVTLVELEALLSATEPREADPASAAPALETWRRTPLQLSSGLQLQVSGWVEPLQHVRSEEPVGLRFAREIVGVSGQPLSPIEHEMLQPAEWVELDTASLDQVRVGVAEWGERPGVFIVPVSFPAFANPAGRAKLAGALGELEPAARARLILEVYGVPDSAPASRLTEALGYMRPVGRGAVMRVSPSRASLERLRGAGLLGVALNGAGMAGPPGQVFGCLKLLADRSRGIAPEVFAMGLPTPELSMFVTAVSGGFYSVRPQAAIASAA